MAKIILMRGLPRSGKSTWAKEFLHRSGNAVIVSRDALREMLHDNKWSPLNEKATIAAQTSIAREMLALNKTVVIDDTNLSTSVVDRWKFFAEKQGATFEIHEEPECDVATLISRDNLSATPRGVHVIIKMAFEFGYIKFAKGELIICDLDGTLCDISHRRQHVDGTLSDKKDWKAFFAGISGDALNVEVADMLKHYTSALGKKIVFVSGRPETYRDVTEYWLQRHGFYSRYAKVPDGAIAYEGLFMRQQHDTRDDDIIKEEILNRYFDKEAITLCIDDRPRVIRMWHRNGLTVVDVGDGEEF